MIAIDLLLRRGEREIAMEACSDGPLLSLVGPSGVGKTSVLHAVAGLVRPDRGRIAVAGRVLFDAKTGVDVPTAERGAGTVFQDGRLLPHRTVAANLRYAERRDGPALIGFDELVEALDLAALLARSPAPLSGGEAKRVAIGRALLSRPAFLLLDEPLAALDAARAEAVLALIERVRDRGVPILHITHDAHEVARLGGAVMEMV